MSMRINDRWFSVYISLLFLFLLFSRYDSSQNHDGARDEKIPVGGGGGGLKRELSLFNSVSYVIGSIIGSGIYITASSTVKYSGSIGLSLILWCLWSVVAIAGGLSYIEIVTLIPSSGGDYPYLRDMYSFGRGREGRQTIDDDNGRGGRKGGGVAMGEGGGDCFSFIWGICWVFCSVGRQFFLTVRPASNAV